MTLPAPERPDGVLVVAKPAGMTSHDVVAHVRRLLGTRRVGHAGTLDPMATGVLVLGVGRATRLLHHLTADSKAYRAVVRLGWETSTDDAEGDPVAPGTQRVDAGSRQAPGAPQASQASQPSQALQTLQALDEAAVRRAARDLQGDIAQVPPAVSAIKVAGRRSYARARAGEEVRLSPRPVRIHRFELVALDEVRTAQPHGSQTPVPYRDAHVEVECSSGTYVRALARDLGRALGTGAHLAALERTRSGAFTLAEAVTLEELAAGTSLTPIAAVLPRVFPVRRVSAAERERLGHGGRIAASGRHGVHAAIDPGGEAVALVTDSEGSCRPVLVFTPA